MPIRIPSSGMSQAVFEPVRILSTKLEDSAGWAMPKTAAANPDSDRNANAPPAPLRRCFTKGHTLAGRPLGSKCSPGTISRAMPLYCFSNLSIGTTTAPLAGSLMYAPFLPKPVNTTKWQLFQNRMQGRVIFVCRLSTP